MGQSFTSLTCVGETAGQQDVSEIAGGSVHWFKYFENDLVICLLTVHTDCVAEVPLPGINLGKACTCAPGDVREYTQKHLFWFWFLVFLQ